MAATEAVLKLETAVTAREPEEADSAAAWRGLFIRFGGTLVFLLTAVATFNYVVNPMCLYATKWAPPLAWNGRGIKADLLQKRDPKPQVLVLGSSRSWKVAPAELEQLTGMPAFNLAVDGGMADDYYLLLRSAVEKAHVQPKLVLISLDVEAFHGSRYVNNFGVDYRVIQAREFGEFLPWNKRIAAGWIGFTRLFVWQQTELSLRSIKMMLRRRLGRAGAFQGVYESDPDGLVHFTIFEADRAKGSYNLDKRVQGDVPGYVKKYQAFTSLSAERQAYFEKTIHYAQEHGARVIVYVPPLQPKMEIALSSTPYAVRKKEVLAYVRRVCAENKVEFHDYSDLNSFGGDPAGFFDGVHPDERTTSQMIRRILAPKGTNAVQ